MGSSSGFQRVALYLYDDETTELTAVATFGLSEEDNARLKSQTVLMEDIKPLLDPAFQVSKSFLYDHKKIKGLPPVFENLSIPDRDGSADPSENWHPLDSLNIPLRSDSGNLLGLISVDEPITLKFPDENHIKALEYFADQCTHAIHKARVNHQLAELASIDHLTGLLNRATFMEQMETAVASTLGKQEDLSILFIDIDHFKSINDKYGHLVGDKVLTNVSSLIKNSLRSNDIVGRYGGEEFIVLLVDTKASSALFVAEELKTSIASSTIVLDHEDMGPISTTASIGVASLTTFPLSSIITLPTSKICNLLINAADQALYRAKHQGRNTALPYTNPEYP